MRKRVSRKFGGTFISEIADTSIFFNLFHLKFIFFKQKKSCGTTDMQKTCSRQSLQEPTFFDALCSGQGCQMFIFKPKSQFWVNLGFS
jgi:hypothetical protein